MHKFKECDPFKNKNCVKWQKREMYFCIKTLIQNIIKWMKFNRVRLRYVIRISLQEMIDDAEIYFGDF